MSPRLGCGGTCAPQRKKKVPASASRHRTKHDKLTSCACVFGCVCECWGIAGDGVGGARRVYTVPGDTCQNHQIHSSDKHSHLDDDSMLQMTAILFDLIRKKLCLSVSHCASLPSFLLSKKSSSKLFLPFVVSYYATADFTNIIFFCFTAGLF